MRLSTVCSFLSTLVLAGAPLAPLAREDVATASAAQSPTTAAFDPAQEARAPVEAAFGLAEPPKVEPPALVAWRDLADKPARWLGRKLRVRLQYASEPATWNPYLTRFGTGQFDALQAWSDEQFPWVRAEFDTPEARVFVRKGSAAQHEFVGADPYARYEVTLVVREVFLDLPWAEVIEVRPMLDRLSEATVIHAARALELVQQEAWRLALLELEAALGAPLPEAANAELVRLRDECAARAAATDSRGAR